MKSRIRMSPYQLTALRMFTTIGQNNEVNTRGGDNHPHKCVFVTTLKSPDLLKQTKEWEKKKGIFICFALRYE